LSIGIMWTSVPATATGTTTIRYSRSSRNSSSREGIIRVDTDGGELLNTLYVAVAMNPTQHQPSAVSSWALSNIASEIIPRDAQKLIAVTPAKLATGEDTLFRSVLLSVCVPLGAIFFVVVFVVVKARSRQRQRRQITQDNTLTPIEGGGDAALILLWVQKLLRGERGVAEKLLRKLLKREAREQAREHGASNVPVERGGGGEISSCESKVVCSSGGNNDGAENSSDNTSGELEMLRMLNETDDGSPGVLSVLTVLRTIDDSGDTNDEDDDSRYEVEATSLIADTDEETKLNVAPAVPVVCGGTMRKALSVSIAQARQLAAYEARNESEEQRVMKHDHEKQVHRLQHMANEYVEVAKHMAQEVVTLRHLHHLENEGGRVHVSNEDSMATTTADATTVHGVKEWDLVGRVLSASVAVVMDATKRQLQIRRALDRDPMEYGDPTLPSTICEAMHHADPGSAGECSNEHADPGVPVVLAPGNTAAETAYYRRMIKRRDTPGGTRGIGGNTDGIHDRSGAIDETEEETKGETKHDQGNNVMAENLPQFCRCCTHDSGRFRCTDPKRYHAPGNPTLLGALEVAVAQLQNYLDAHGGQFVHHARRRHILWSEASQRSAEIGAMTVTRLRELVDSCMHHRLVQHTCVVYAEREKRLAVVASQQSLDILNLLENIPQSEKESVGSAHITEAMAGLYSMRKTQQRARAERREMTALLWRKTKAAMAIQRMIRGRTALALDVINIDIWEEAEVTVLLDELVSQVCLQEEQQAIAERVDDLDIELETKLEPDETLLTLIADVDKDLKAMGHRFHLDRAEFRDKTKAKHAGLSTAAESMLSTWTSRIQQASKSAKIRLQPISPTVIRGRLPALNTTAEGGIDDGEDFGGPAVAWGGVSLSHDNEALESGGMKTTTLASLVAEVKQRLAAEASGFGSVGAGGVGGGSGSGGGGAVTGDIGDASGVCDSVGDKNGAADSGSDGGGGSGSGPSEMTGANKLGNVSWNITRSLHRAHIAVNRPQTIHHSSSEIDDCIASGCAAAPVTESLGAHLETEPTRTPPSLLARLLAPEHVDERKNLAEGALLQLRDALKTDQDTCGLLHRLLPGAASHFGVRATQRRPRSAPPARFQGRATRAVAINPRPRSAPARRRRLSERVSSMWQNVGSRIVPSRDGGGRRGEECEGGGDGDGSERERSAPSKRAVKRALKLMRPRANLNLPPLRKSGGSGGHVEAREGGRAVKAAAWGVVSEGTKASAETKGEPKAAAGEQEGGGVDVSGKRPVSEARSRRSLNPLGIHVVDNEFERADAVDVGQGTSGGERGVRVDTGRCSQMSETKGVPSSLPSHSEEANTVAQEDEDGGGGEEQDARARRATDAESAKEREAQGGSVHQPACKGNDVDDDDRDGLRGNACVNLKSVPFAGDGSGGSDAAGGGAAGGDGGGAVDIFSKLRRVAEDTW
jgi:hypothetical protein